MAGNNAEAVIADCFLDFHTVFPVNELTRPYHGRGGQSTFCGFRWWMDDMI